MSMLVHYFRKNSMVLGVYLLLILFIIIFNIFTPMTPAHLIEMIRQAAPLGIAAIGQTVCLLMGGIDLSVGATISLTNVLACSIMLGDKQNIPESMVVIVLVSLLIGFINGLAVVKANIPPFLATLAMSIIIKGGYYIYTKGSPVGSIAAEFRVISEGWLGFIPIAGLIWLCIWILLAFFLYRTTAGLKFYSTGGNPQASWLSGINTNHYTVLAYVFSSLMATFAGLMISAYIGVTSANVGDPYTLNSIAATCIGGTAFTGGRGGLGGTFAGVMIITVIQAFMTMMNVPEAGKQLSLGIIIIIMVAINQKMGNKK